MVQLQDIDRPVLFFDGVCNLCNAAVQFVIKQDKKKQFLFASLQSNAGKEALAELQKTIKIAPDSVVLFYKGRYFVKSDAVLRSVKILGGLWRLLLVGYVLPRFMRDGLYDIIARNRYKWFGKRESCMIPTPELSSRFLT